MADSKIILVTGPESTGKTELCRGLSDKYNALWVPEYARGYVEKLSTDYSFEDVVHIARKQILQYNDVKQVDAAFCFFDTGLIITKVWFEVKYGSCPEFLLNALNEMQIDHVLLCKPDLPWVHDRVRENGGLMREKLYNQYKYEIESRNFTYTLVEGFGDARINSAIAGLQSQNVVPL